MKGEMDSETHFVKVCLHMHMHVRSHLTSKHTIASNKSNGEDLCTS